jgi:hypothetical protein
VRRVPARHSREWMLPRDHAVELPVPHDSVHTIVAVTD